MEKVAFQKFEVYLEVYDFTVYFCIGDKKKTIDFVNKMSNLPDKEAAIENYIVSDLNKAKGMRLRRSGYSPTIWLPRKPQTPEEYGTLYHEIFHVICDVFLRWTKIPLSSDSEESYCHLISYITRKFLNEVK